MRGCVSIDTLQKNIYITLYCVGTVEMGEQHNLIEVVFLLPPEYN